MSSATRNRSILFIVNPNRTDATDAVNELARKFTSAGFSLFTTSTRAINGLRAISAEELS